MSVSRQQQIPARQSRPSGAGWWVLATAVVLTAGGAGGHLTAQAPVQPVYGPATFIRQTAKPVVERVTIKAAAGTYRLCVINGGQSDQFTRVTSAIVTMNGETVLRQNHFNRGVLTLAAPVTLRANNTLTVELNGDPKSGLALWIIQSASCAGITANGPPRIVSAPVTGATWLEPYAYQVVAADPDHDPLTFSLDEAPSGMTIDPVTGLISWMPPGTGTLPVTVRVSDNRGGSVTQAFDLVVSAPPNRPPQLVPIANRQIPLGALFRLRLAAVDPDPGDVLTFGLTAGPSAASVSDGLFDWTPGPGQVGFHGATVRVDDAAGAFDTKSFTIQVVDTAGAPMLDPQPDATILAGTLFERTITATDPDPGDTLTFSLVSGPAGLTLSLPGLLAWEPTTAQLGPHPVKVMVTDGTGLSDVGEFTLSVDLPVVSQQPPVAVDDLYAVRRGTTLQVPAPGVLENDVDPGGLPLSAQLVTPAVKGTLNLSSTGGFSYAPAAPAAASTTPRLAFAFAHEDMVTVNTQPVVADLNGDGVPEIVFLALRTSADRRLIAVRGDTGALVFARNAYQPLATPKIVLYAGNAGASATLTVGDLDGDGTLEILAVHSDDETAALRRRIIAFNSDGSYRWTSDDIVDGTFVGPTTGMFRLTLADLDADGTPEILSLHRTGPSPQKDAVTVFNADGSLRWTKVVDGPTSTYGLVVADIDLDGYPDIVIGRAVLDHQGNVKWNAKGVNPGTWDMAVANLDDDPYAEIVYVDVFGNLIAYEHTGALKWGPVNRPNYDTWGNLTIGDVDGDGQPEILLARDHVNGIIEVRNRNGVLVRELSVPGYDTLGHGGNTTIFDLNGDGRPEILYLGARGPFDAGPTLGALYIFDGPDGTLLHSVQATRSQRIGGDTGPVVADVDGDGSAEIVTGGWDDAALLRVFKAETGSWARTRPIWNQFAYHVTNVEPDGTIPATPHVNWLTPGLNNFRVNVPLPSERTEDFDQFTYQASTGAQISNVATVSLHILPPNNAPRILSTPPPAAAPGIEYVYAVRAFDPDPGELITYSLPVGPAGMTIDSSTGLLRWTPGAGASGQVGVVVKATDSQNQSDQQQFTIAIGAARLVPNVAGLTQTAAGAELATAGLTVGTVSLSPSALVPAGEVMSQEPQPGTAVAAGSPVNLVVSSGPAPVTVPYLVGKSESTAMQQLTGLGLGHAVVRAFSSTVPDGRVISQEPAAGTSMVSGAVTLTVSVGNGLSLRLHREITTPDVSIPFTVEAYDLTYAETALPGLTYAITPAIVPGFGALPTVVGSTIVPDATSRGPFRLTATDPATGRQVSAEFSVGFPRTPGQRSMTDVYAAMSEAMSDIDDLLDLGQAALANNAPEETLRSLLQQMVDRWQQVDPFELKLTTPFGLPQGFMPSPAELPTLGLSPTPDDLFAQQVLKDAVADLDAWIDGLREPSTSLAALDELASRFTTRAARLNGLEMSEWGVIKGAPYFTMIMSDLLPGLYTAIFDEIEQVVAQSALLRQRIEEHAHLLRGPGIIPASAIVSGSRRSVEAARLAAASTLSEQLVAIALRKTIDHIKGKLEDAFENPVKKFREQAYKRISWGAAAVVAAQRFKERVQGQPVTAVIAGGSMSFHVFRAFYSAIEADIDADHPGNTVVLMIGPDQVDTADAPKVQDELQPLANAVVTQQVLFNTLNQVHKWLKKGETSAKGIAERVSGAFQPRPQGYRGCLFDSSPTCGQLLYEEGFRSVYTLDPDNVYDKFTGIPIPIILIVYDKTTGVVRIDTPVFLPWLPLPPSSP